VIVTTRNTILALGLCALAACGGHSGPATPQPLPSADAAVREFMAAVADSNIDRMGRVWGSADGPAALTGKPDRWHERLMVVQLWLRGATFRIVRDAPNPTSPAKRDLLVELTRGSCVKAVPFTAAPAGTHGWLVESVDINAAGNPANPCPTGGT
jgi:hypothetical protein